MGIKYYYFRLYFNIFKEALPRGKYPFKTDPLEVKKVGGVVSYLK